MNKTGSANWEAVKALFEQVLSRPFAERDAFLSQASAGDDALRREVESLIKSYEQAESFMESPAVEAAADSLLANEDKLTPGQRLSHYEILAAIGEGGMGEVYLTKDTRLGRRVALKLLPAYFTGDEKRLRRFEQEARAASALNHPNVCVIHEVGETEDGRPFITMEHVDGVTLRQHLAGGALTLGETLDLAIQVADALVAAHEAGIVHRDIKPENLMIRRDGYVKVLDFGLAKLTEKSGGFDSLTATTLLRTSTPGLVMGTVAYMSPEQARGVNVDARTDIWSLGVVVYEMISGHAPFSGETPTDVVVGIVEKDQPPLAEAVAGLPAELERIVKKALRKNRDERYQLAKEMAIDLRSLRRELQAGRGLERSVSPALTADRKQIEAHRSTSEVDTTRRTETVSIEKPSAKFFRPVPIAVAVILLGVIGFFAVRYFIRSTAPASRRFQRINVTKLTTNGNAAFAAISRDGKYVAYVMNEGGQQSLWLRQVAVDNNLRLLPAREGRYLGIAFSPDGDFIFYGYVASGTNQRPELYRTPVLPGASAIRMNLYNGPPAPSHDGKRIAFFRYDDVARTDILIVANPDGSNEQAVTTRKWPERFGWNWDARPAWSGDDQKLSAALVDTNANNFFLRLYEISLSDRAENVITLSGQKFELLDGVSMFEDASGVMATAKAQGASFFQLWEVLRDGSARQITNDLSDYLGLSMTADANAVVTVQRQVLSNIWAAPKTETTRATPVTSGAGRYFDITWAPDGKIIYASDASGSAHIYEMDPGNLTAKILTDVGRNYAPAVSPDGRYIAFHSNRDGVFKVYRADRDGSNPKRLTNDSSESNWPQFTPDGQWVVYQTYVSGPSTLWKVPIDGGTPVKISDTFAMRPAISPDGKWIACWYRAEPNPPRLAIIPFAGGPPAKIFDVAPTVEVSWDVLIRWSPDGRGVSYVDHRGGFDNIWLQPLDGGAPRQVTDFKDSRIFSFDWSRDGRLLLSRGVQTNDVVLISDAK
jgi:serine/threonine protein kinase/Tol biopolymer transport system component